MYLSAITCASDLRRCELSTGGRPFTSRRQSSITQGATRLPPEGHRAATRSGQRRVGEKKTNTPPRSKKSAGRQTCYLVIGLVLWSSRCLTRGSGEGRRWWRGDWRARGGAPPTSRPRWPSQVRTSPIIDALGLPRWRQTSRAQRKHATTRPSSSQIHLNNHRHDVGLLARTKRRSPPPPTPPSEMTCDRVFVVR